MRLRYNNITKAYLITIILFILFISTIVFPLLCLYLFPNAGIAYYIIKWQNYFLFTIPILLYFIINGVYIYNININPYSITITSHRIIADFFNTKEHIDIAHNMIKGYSFFNRPFTINNTIVIKLGHRNKKVIKRFNMSLISKKQIKEISKALDSIIVKHN